MKTIKDFIGNWPPNVDAARKEKRHILITPEEALTVIHGNEHESKFTFFISNEKCHVGKIEICPGKHTDPETHKGDEILMVLKGKLQIVILSELADEKSVSRKAYELEEGGRFLIPEGYKHQYFNLGIGMTEVLFSIAPQL
jgi:mannose-6-phosphate isomerase-like protein (cupin superfamily)